MTSIEKAIDWIDDYSCLSVYMSGEYAAHMRKSLTREIHDTILHSLEREREEQEK